MTNQQKLDLIHRIEVVILKYVENNSGNSMVNIRDELYKNFPKEIIEGDYMWIDGTNVLWWTGISQEFVFAMAHLTRSKQISIRPAHLLIYMVDGCILNYPQVEEYPKEGYKTPHWLPLIIDKYSNNKDLTNIINEYWKPMDLSEEIRVNWG